MSIYQEILLEHYKNPKNFGPLPGAKSLQLNNPLCGDIIQMNVLIKDNKVENITFEGKGCAISTASASLLTEYAKGKHVDELRKLDKSFILDIIGIDLSPNRLKCALLPLEVLQKTL
jgi:nitrogen fixation NifU-like protein